LAERGTTGSESSIYREGEREREREKERKEINEILEFLE